MKRIFVILAFLTLVILVFVTSCKKDIILEPLPTLEGTYTGIYQVVDGYNGPNEVTTESSVEMLFSSESYFFNSDNTPDPFCSPRGTYLLAANTINLDESQENCAGVIASKGDNPNGEFSIRRPGDSVIMIQIDTTTLKRILLEKN